MQENMIMICFKDNNKPAHLVGHSKLRPLDIYDFFFKSHKNIMKKKASVTGKTEEDKNTTKKPYIILIQMKKIIKEFIKMIKNWLQWKKRGILWNIRKQ